MIVHTVLQSVAERARRKLGEIHTISHDVPGGGSQTTTGYVNAVTEGGITHDGVQIFDIEIVPDAPR